MNRYKILNFKDNTITYIIKVVLYFIVYFVSVRYFKNFWNISKYLSFIIYIPEDGHVGD
jgi:hypothetical protein